MAVLDDDAQFHGMLVTPIVQSSEYRYEGTAEAIMTSEERREARYQRRKSKRLSKRPCEADDFDKVFSYHHLYESYKKCRKSVAWKASVQKYIAQAPLNLCNTYRRLQEGKYRTAGFCEFDVVERGKKRHIKSVLIDERVVQRTLCDYALTPMLTPMLIFDNGASIENKGYSFAVNRITEHLHRHYRHHGREGYVLVFDFSRFFDNVSHEVIKKILHEKFTDERIIAVVENFIDAFGDKGLGLGSQISQIFALLSANRLDHFIKEELRIKYYARYMDDGYLIHESKEYLQECLGKIQQLCAELGIVLNDKKTQIVKLSHGFTWLKIRFFLTEKGKVIRKIYKRSVVKERRKLKKLNRQLEAGKLDFSYIYACWRSWASYAANFNAWHTTQNMAHLYNDLFIRKGLCNVYQGSQ